MPQTATKENVSSQEQPPDFGHVPLLSAPEWAVVTAGILSVVLMTLRPGSPFLFKSFINLSQIVGPFLAAVWCLTRVCRAGRVRHRAAACLGLGALGYAVGQAIWSWYEIILHCDCPFPSWADAGFLSAYPFLLAGILWMPRRPLPSALHGRVLLDGLMVMTAVVTFSWYFLLGPTLLQGGETLLGKVIGLAYPVADIGLLFCLLVLGAQDGTGLGRRGTILLCFGLIAIIIADTAFAYKTLQGTYQTGGWSDLGWITGYMLIGAGGCALLQPRSAGAGWEQLALVRNPVLWRLLAPYALVPAAGALLCYTLVKRGNEHLELGVWIGSALLLGLLLLRQVCAILENSKLYRYSQEAYREMEDVKVMLEVQNRSLAEANARLESLATTDGLTGLTNHRAFHERLEAEWRCCAAVGRPLALILLDVDRFKQYNDAYGHPAGDEVLQTVARLLSAACRDGDLAARHGGEEYSLILPLASEEAAIAVAERLRVAIATHAWPRRPVTASLGLAFAAPGMAAPGDLITAADAALYRSKSEGRNRVTSTASAVRVLAAA